MGGAPVSRAQLCTRDAVCPTGSADFMIMRGFYSCEECIANMPTFIFKRQAAMVTIACAGALVPAMGLAATVSAASAARAATPASVPRCAPSALAVLSGRSTGAVGTIAAEFGFTNHSAKTCSLHGYPGVQMLTKSGKNLSTTDEKAPGAFSIEEKAVVLAPGKTAYFGVLYADQTGYAKLTCPTSAALKFTPPQDTRTVTLHGSHAQIAPYGGSTGHTHCGIVRVTAVTAKRFQ